MSYRKKKIAVDEEVVDEVHKDFAKNKELAEWFVSYYTWIVDKIDFRATENSMLIRENKLITYLLQSKGKKETYEERFVAVLEYNQPNEDFVEQVNHHFSRFLKKELIWTEKYG